MQYRLYRVYGKLAADYGVRPPPPKTTHKRLMDVEKMSSPTWRASVPFHNHGAAAAPGILPPGATSAPLPQVRGGQTPPLGPSLLLRPSRDWEALGSTGKHCEARMRGFLTSWAVCAGVRDGGEQPTDFLRPSARARTAPYQGRGRSGGGAQGPPPGLNRAAGERFVNDFSAIFHSTRSQGEFMGRIDKRIKNCG